MKKIIPIVLLITASLGAISLKALMLLAEKINSNKSLPFTWKALYR
jgi:hypothetical protein